MMIAVPAGLCVRGCPQAILAVVNGKMRVQDQGRVHRLLWL